MFHFANVCRLVPSCVLSHYLQCEVFRPLQHSVSIPNNQRQDVMDFRGNPTNSAFKAIAKNASWPSEITVYFQGRAWGSDYSLW